MIERQTINGRPATVGYLDQNFNPAPKAAAAIVKLSFDDGETTFLSDPSAPPVVPRQPRGRLQTPHDSAVQGFALAMQKANMHRTTLKDRFGYDDKQIGLLAKAALRKRTRRPLHDLAAAVIRAKRRSSRNPGQAPT